MSLLILTIISVIYIAYAVVKQRRSQNNTNNSNNQTQMQIDSRSLDTPNPNHIGHKYHTKTTNISHKNNNDKKQNRENIQQCNNIEQTEEDTITNILPDFGDEQQMRQAIIATEILNRKYI